MNKTQGTPRMRTLGIALGWLIAGSIVWLSVTHRPPVWHVSNGDKIQHLLAYATLSFWFGLLYPRLGARVLYAAGWVLLGVALEYVQRALGYRTFDINDMAADGLGVALGLAFATFVAGFQLRPSMRST